MAFVNCLTIGGVPYDEWLWRDSLNHAHRAGSEPDFLDFDLVLGAPRPETWAEVYYQPIGMAEPIFGGIVTAAPAPSEGTVGVSWRVRCSDWRELARSKKLNRRWVGLQPHEILTDAFTTYAPMFDLSGVEPGGPAIPSLTYRRDGDLIDLLDWLAQSTGYVWDITPTKKLVWGPPGTTPCPMALVDGGLDFKDLVVTANAEGMATVVYVRGRPRPSPDPLTDRFPGDGLTSSFRLTGTPYGLDEYVLLQGDFPRGIDAGTWLQTDATNPSPPPGHIPSDGYLFTTLQQGPELAESGWLQVVGGTGTWGQVNLISQNSYPRGDGRNRVEWEVSITTSAKDGMVGLWDPANAAAQAGCRYGFAFDAGTGNIRPWANGSVQTALATVSYAGGETVRLRVIPKASAGAELWVNKDALNGFRASQWTKLLDTNLGSWTTSAVMAINSRNFEGRVRRVRVFQPLYNATLTVNGAAKTVGLLGVDTDAGVDALIGLSADVPQLVFFADTIPANGHTIVITYTQAIPTSIRLPDNAAIAALKAILNPTNDPAGHDGVLEYVHVDNKVDNLTTALYVAQGLLNEKANPELQVSFKTHVLGIRGNQVLATNLTQALSGRDLTQSFLITSVVTRPWATEDHEADVQGTSRLRGIEGLLASLLRQAQVVPQFEDQDTPLEEFLNGSDVLAFSDAGSLSGPVLVGADTLALAEVGAFAAGPNPASGYLYGVALYGAALLA